MFAALDQRCLALLLFGAASCLGAPAAGGEMPEAPDRSRHRAAVIALFAPDAVPGEEAAAGAESGEASPLRRFAACLLAQGGFSPAATARCFQLADGAPARAGKVLRQLDLLAEREPLPLRSLPAVPDALLAAAVTALVYSQAETDGVEAAAFCGALFSDQASAPFGGRAIFKALALCLRGARDRRDIVFLAAEAAADEAVGREIRAAVALPQERLAEESSYSGRLQRALWLWLRVDDYESLCRQGRNLLRDASAWRLLLALWAAHRGMEGLPAALRSRGSRDAELLDLEIDLFELATRGLILPVAAKLRPESEEPTPGETATSPPQAKCAASDRAWP